MLLPRAVRCWQAANQGGSDCRGPSQSTADCSRGGCQTRSMQGWKARGQLQQQSTLCMTRSTRWQQWQRVLLGQQKMLLSALLPVQLARSRLQGMQCSMVLLAWPAQPAVLSRPASKRWLMVLKPAPSLRSMWWGRLRTALSALWKPLETQPSMLLRQWVIQHKQLRTRPSRWRQRPVQRSRTRLLMLPRLPRPQLWMLLVLWIRLLAGPLRQYSRLHNRRGKQ